MTESESQQPGGVSRRTVTKAMAWAVPVIAVAAPIPAFAASQGIVSFTGRGCKDPGNSIPGNPGSKAYFVELTITNTTNAQITVTFLSATVNNVAPIQPPGFEATPSSTNVPANNKQTLVLRIGNWADSANATISLTYEVGGVQGTATVTLIDTPPIQGEKCPLVYPYSVNTPV